MVMMGITTARGKSGVRENYHSFFLGCGETHKLYPRDDGDYHRD
jgi:hypothetical protein